MNLTDLITKLQTIKEQYGNIPVLLNVTLNANDEVNAFTDNGNLRTADVEQDHASDGMIVRLSGDDVGE